MISQVQFINKILQDKDFSLVTLNNLSADYFFNYRAEFNYIKNHYDLYKTVPDKLTFANAFPDFDFVEVNEPIEYLLDQLYKDYNQSYLATRFNQVKKLLEQDKIDDAVKYFMDSTENIHQGAAMTCTDLTTDTSRYDRYVEKTKDWSKGYISTGFPEVDKLIGGIDRENENMVIAARTGIGKTYTMLKMAASASEQGFTVGIYEGEMTADKVGYRIDTLLGNINNSYITRGRSEVNYEYQNYIKGLAGRNLGPIKVITPTDVSGPVTVNTLRAFIIREHIQIMFVDQYSLLEDTSHARTSFERVGNIAKEIKKLQVELGIPIIAVSQMNRTKTDSGEQDTTQIGLSDMIPQYATVLLMLDRKDEDKLVINIVKSRDGGGNKKLTYICDWNNGIFTYLPDEKDSVSTHEDIENIRESYNMPLADNDGTVF